MKACVLFAFYTSIHLVSTYNPLIRRTKYGYVSGTIERSKPDPSIEFYSFIGIPYARPPVKNLRFQSPLPPNYWINIRDAKRNPPICTQFSNFFKGQDVIGSEDCLYLNVFIPKSVRQNKTDLMPVLVWIHGGNFIFDSNSYQGPEYTMEHELVVVTMQYRLNVFGFFSTMDEYACGNWGLKDQVMALKWVQENIGNFNGDSNRVTIVGESAGGASVQYHILSPKSRGLFQRAISHSGSTLSRWAHQEHPRRMVIKLARAFGIRNTNSREIVQKLRYVDYTTLLKYAFNTTTVGYYTPYYAQPFSTSIENGCESAFITNSTYELLEKGLFHNVSYILGFNTEEGSFPYTYIHEKMVDINRYEKNPSNLIPVALNIPKNSLCAKEVLDQIRNFYFNKGSFTHKANWINYMSQELFVRSIRKSVEFMHKHIPLYYYRFSFRGSRNESYLGGVGHHEELLYLWRNRREGANTNETERDELTRRRLVKMWYNFAANGDPTPESDPLLENIRWPRVTTNENVPFIDIDDHITIKYNPEQKHYEFWEQLFELYGNPPYTSY